MTSEERIRLLRTYVTAFKLREITPEWFLCISPHPLMGHHTSSQIGPHSIAHICKPRVWEMLACGEYGEGGIDESLYEHVHFSPFRNHKCDGCNAQMPSWAITVGRLFILGSQL
jgi:hypothetical protein